MKHHINPFYANLPFLYPLKTTENPWFSGIFRGYTNGTLAMANAWKNELTVFKVNTQITFVVRVP